MYSLQTVDEVLLGWSAWLRMRTNT